MSLRELQTAAARVFHVERLDDRSIQELKARFRYHPLDVEALFSVPVEPSFSTYSGYAFVTLLWPDAETGDTGELRFFIDHQQLTIVGDTPSRGLRKYIEQLSNLGGPESQYTAPELFHELLRRLRQTWSISPAALSVTAAARLAANAQVIRQLGRWLQNSHLPMAVPQLIIDAHTLDSLAERPLSPTATSITDKQSAVAIPSLLQMYSVISAVMVLAVIVTLSIR